MTNKLIYKEGDLVGIFKTLYIKEVHSCGRYRKALFVCSFCGDEFVAAISKIAGGTKKSCGCKARRKTESSPARTHGFSSTKLYSKWNCIKRGEVCKEWSDSFEIFQEWAVSSGYKEGDSILRKKRGLVFSPGNCTIGTKGSKPKGHGGSNTFIYKHWNSVKQYCKNRNIEIEDKWKNDFEVFRDWAVKNNYSPGQQIERKDYTKGVSAENCYYQSFKKNERRCWLNGEEMNFSRAANILNVSRQMIYTYSKGKAKKIPGGLEFSSPINKI